MQTTHAPTATTIAVPFYSPSVRGYKGVNRVVEAIAQMGGHGDSEAVRKAIPSVSASSILVGLRMATQQGILVESKEEQERRRSAEQVSCGRPRKVYFLASALRGTGELAPSCTSPRVSMFVEAALKNRHELDRAWMSVASCGRADDEVEEKAPAPAVKKAVAVAPAPVVTHRFECVSAV